MATSIISIGGATYPSDGHAATAKSTINYLLQHPYYDLVLGRRKTPLSIFAYADAS